MDDIKTSLTGLITGLAGILAHFGVIIPEGWTMPIVIVGSTLVAFFAKDAKKSS